MTDIMDCQYCGGPAVLGGAAGLPHSFQHAVQCECCGMRGYPTLDGQQEQAIKAWNRIQSLIAKGILVEATQSKRSKSL